MDEQKVLDVALEKGYRNLDDAFNEAYREDILNKEVETRMGSRVEEEIAKRQTRVETGSGAQPLKFDLGKDAPKTWTDAGQQFLEERAKEANKPPTPQPTEV